MPIRKLLPLLAAAGLGLLLGACAQHQSSDADITDRVTADLRTATILPAQKVTVQTVDHVVYLNGVADTESDIRAAGDVANRVPGVTRVVNNLAVQR